MKKLTATQQEVLDICCKKIDTARAAANFEEWYTITTCNGDSERAALYLSRGDNEWERKNYEEYKAGKVLVICNSRTLKALETAGYIEIVNASRGGSYSPDTVQVLNY